MKKILLTLALLGAVGSSAFAQGLVFFFAGASNATKMSTNSVVGGAATGRTLGDGTYYYALFASSTLTTVNGNSAAISGAQGAGAYVFQTTLGSPSTAWEEVGIGTNAATSQNTPGYALASSQGTSDGTQAALNGDGSLAINGVAGAASANFIVVGWSANIGSTLAALEAWYASPTVAGWIGQSRVGSLAAVGNGGSQPASNIYGTSPSVGGFNLGEIAPTPEPGTMVLAGLGGLSLLALRRKK